MTHCTFRVNFGDKPFVWSPPLSTTIANDRSWKRQSIGDAVIGRLKEVRTVVCFSHCVSAFAFPPSYRARCVPFRERQTLSDAMLSVSPYITMSPSAPAPQLSSVSSGVSSGSASTAGLEGLTQALRPLDPPTESRPKDHTLRSRSGVFPVPETLSAVGSPIVGTAASQPPLLPLSARAMPLLGSLRPSGSFRSLGLASFASGASRLFDVQYYKRAHALILKRIETMEDTPSLQQLIGLAEAVVRKLEGFTSQLDAPPTITTITKARRDTELFDTFEFPPLELPPQPPVSPGRLAAGGGPASGKSILAASNSFASDELNTESVLQRAEEWSSENVEAAIAALFAEELGCGDSVVLGVPTFRGASYPHVLNVHCCACACYSIDNDASSNRVSPAMGQFDSRSTTYSVDVEDALGDLSTSLPYAKLLERESVESLIRLVNEADYRAKFNATFTLGHLAMDSSCISEVSLQFAPRQ